MRSACTAFYTYYNTCLSLFPADSSDSSSSGNDAFILNCFCGSTARSQFFAPLVQCGACAAAPRVSSAGGVGIEVDDVQQTYDRLRTDCVAAGYSIDAVDIKTVTYTPGSAGGDISASSTISGGGFPVVTFDISTPSPSAVSATAGVNQIQTSPSTSATPSTLLSPAENGAARKKIPGGGLLGGWNGLSVVVALTSVFWVSVVL